MVKKNKFKNIKDQHKINLDSIHVTLNNITQMNNDLKAEVSKQKEHIKSLEEAISPEVETDAEVHNIEAVVHSEEAGQRVNMSKDSREHRCHACDRIFKAEPDLDRHMKDKHTEAECHMCNKKFTS